MLASLPRRAETVMEKPGHTVSADRSSSSGARAALTMVVVGGALIAAGCGGSASPRVAHILPTKATSSPGSDGHG